MKLLDANVLLHAYNPTFPDHRRASDWLEDALSGTEPVGLAWITILVFLRVSTSPRGFPKPLTIREAANAVSTWLERPNVRLIEPDSHHWTALRHLMETSNAGGNLTSDAHLAALALQHGATLCTNDRDFARFPGLKLLDPLEA